MPVDASIYSQFAQPAKSVNDYKAQYDAADLRALGLSKNRLDLTNQQAIMAQRDALRADVQSGAIDLNNPQHRNALMSKYPDIAPSLLDQIDKGALTRSTVDLNTAHAGNFRAEADKNAQAAGQSARIDEIRQVANLNSADDAKALLQQYSRSGHIPPELAAGLGRMIDTDPKWQVKLMLAAVDPKSAAEMLMPHLQTTDLGGSKVTQAVDKITGAPVQTGAFPVTQSPDNAATQATALRDQDMRDARARDLNKITREGQQTQIVTDPNMGVLLVDKGTGTYKPAMGTGGPIPGEAKVAANKMTQQLGAGIKAARELIPKATSSGAGALVDSAAGFVGKATEGADAAAQLETLAGWMTSNVPRMQGPQSDKDTMLYKQMAAQVGDRTKPASARLKALDTLEQLQNKYAAINGTAPISADDGMPAAVAAALKKHGAGGN